MTDSNPPGTAPPKKGKGKKRNPAAPPFILHSAVRGKPELVVYGFDLTITARALAKLLAEKCDNLFVHNHKLVVVKPPDDDDDMPRMRSAGVKAVIIAAHKYCQPFRPKDGERPPVTLPDEVAELYLAMPEEWRLRPLTSFANGPMLRDDGTISCEKGYDVSTGVYIYNVPQITVPDKPSRADANRALATLRRAFRTFAFADRIAIDEIFSVGGDKFIVKVVDLKQPPGRDESAFLAALLTAVCRPSLPIAPAIAMRSATLSGSGVGKKLLLDAISHVAFGQGAPSVALGKGKEFEKGVVAAVIRPDPMLVIDNFNGRELQSETLCTVLTDRPAMVRVLGVSDLKEANPRMLICIAGNGYTFAEDLVRRNFVIELDAKLENPELRKFAGNFLADIAQQRPQLLQAALTIWRYGRQQVKSNSPPLGGFEQWSAWVRDPLVALGCEDPVSVAKITKHKTSDPTRLETVEILQAWWEHHGKDEVTANELHEAVKALLVPDAKKRSRQAVASLVAKLDGTRLAGFHLTSDKDDENRGRWTAVSYRLEWVKDESEQTTDAAPAADIHPDEADDPDAWQFYREGDDAAARPAAPEAPQGANESTPSDQASTSAKTNGGSEPLMSWEIDGLVARGFTRTELFDDPANPQKYRNILTDPRYERLERFTLGAKTAEPCLQCFEGRARMITFVDRRGRQQTVALHLKCAPIYEESGNLPVEDEAPAPEPEAAAGSAEEDDADGWQFNHEPDIAAAADTRPGEAAEQRAPEPEPKPNLRVLTPMPMPPSDPVERWRTCFARLDPARDPCAGFRTGDWARIYNVVRTFLAGPFAKHAADAGWTDLELFGVHPEVGVARPNACGALMTNAYGSPVTQVTAQLIRFANGLAVYKARLSGNSVAVWNYGEPAANECATCRIGSPPWSEE